jgi:hypothetical protein
MENQKVHNLKKDTSRRYQGDVASEPLDVYVEQKVDHRVKQGIEKDDVGYGVTVREVD